jgi:hypothetical protein
MKGIKLAIKSSLESSPEQDGFIGQFKQSFKEQSGFGKTSRNRRGWNTFQLML